jgi:iron complex transport system ATP-binding protein
MDEPSASLDYGNKLRVMETVKSLTKDDYTIIQSTHDPDQAYLYSDQILALYDGKILVCGTPRDTISSALISTLYGVDVEVCSMRGDDIRVCVPAHLEKGGKP